MKVGDLVKYRRTAVNAGVGVIVRNAEKHSWNTEWWLVLWSNGATETISNRKLKVINASR